MLFVRKIGSVLRGNATPLQVQLATILGGTLGFVPGFFLPGDLGGGFMQAPGLILVLLCCALILNANLGLFGFVTLVAKMASLALLPVSYALGTWLLDGPLAGLYRTLINGKVTAWFGLEYYATAGGVVLGLVFGVASGLLINTTLRALRTRLATLEESSEAFQKYANKKWVRLLAWIFLGKSKGKQSWREIADKRYGMPVRITGIAFAAVFVGSIWIFQQWFSTPILTSNVQSALQAMNGATVDLEAATLDLGSGSLRFQKLAIADSGALDKDLFAADEMTADLSTGELLRKRFVIDDLVSSTARGGTPRSKPGVLIPDETPPPPPPPPPTGTKTIEDYLKDLEVWKQRLETARGWIDKVAGGDDKPPPEAQTPEQRQEERKRQVDHSGLVGAVATHLIEGGPRVLIRRIRIDGIAYSINGKADKLDLKAQNVSDLPSAVAEAIGFDVRAQSGTMAVALKGPEGTASDRATKGTPSAMAFEFLLRGIAIDDVFGKLKIGGAPPLRGGTMDFATKGSMATGARGDVAIDLPLNVTMKNTTFALAGSKETKVDSLLLPIGLRGPLTRPSVALDDKVLQQALLQAGQRELANFVQGQAGQLLGGVPVPGLDPNKPMEQQIDEAKKKAEEEARRRLEEEAKKRAAEELQKHGLPPLPGFPPPPKKE